MYTRFTFNLGGNMNIIVLCGGLSAERDVSITSGGMIAAALRRLGHRAVLVDLFFGYTRPYSKPEDIFSDTDESGDIVSVGEKVPDIEMIKRMRGDGGSSRMGDNVLEVCRAADIVFLALHGEDGEDGKIQAAFDLAGIKYTGSGMLGSAMTMDKGVAKQIFIQNGIPTPPGIVVHKAQFPRPEVGFPCVVKPKNGGSSVGTSIVRAKEEYADALEFAFKFEDYAVVEKYIEGRECDVGVLRGRALPVIEICPKGGFYDYKHKYQDGLAEEFCPADLPEETTQLLYRTAEHLFKVLQLSVYARMDFIVDKDGGIWCLEGNTLPGMTPTSLLPQEAAVAGISYDELCAIIIEESLKKY